MFKIFKKDREKEKTETVHSILDRISNSTLNFNHSEQTEILNRVSLLLFEKKKETRDTLVRQAREVQESLKDIKI